MAVNLAEPEGLMPVPGVRLAAIRTGIKDAPRDDLALALFDEGTVIAGVYTQSAFAAPPVALAKERLTPRAWIVNSGNANAATGQPGRADAIAVCDAVARELGLQGDDIQPFSTGVIGERLDVSRICAAIPALVKDLSPDQWLGYGKAILTTDTVTKAVSKRVSVDGTDIILTGVAKGSGMIKPNMATMLGYIACNASVAPDVLEQMVQEVADGSFNRITVDGDTSTNDCFMLAATGKSEMAAITSVTDERYVILQQAVLEVAQTLAQAIVRDGEGATKFVTITVAGGHHAQECLEVAYTVAESPLVKTALFAGDANWGRFCMAIGRARVAKLAPNRVSLWLDKVQVASGGLMADDYTEDAGASVLAQDEFRGMIDLGRGDATETVWTTDLSYEYVRINAEYRS
ncbi:MAG: bifunctional glutamate N-acetyltransferase/amino-acid acetyltransferase ArgJ [Proteobacteria bacterium]|nr:bifunctional glutamate N-acetyltransferase/amino-acid acetyltransferase ArgJ [Pseudomonadota bacterium]